MERYKCWPKYFEVNSNRVFIILFAVTYATLFIVIDSSDRSFVFLNHFLFVMAPTKGESKSLLTNKEIEHQRTCCSRKMVILSVSVFTIALSAITLSFVSVSSYPLHASCRVDWTFGKPCDQVQTALVNQMQKWNMNTKNLCGTGQKCLYQYLSSTPTKLTGTHTTPVKSYVDDVSYTFTPAADNSCNVQGFSTSQTWYAILDYGTNYCNIKNLVDGANLGSNDSKYSENTSDSVCTQYSSANCEVY